MSKTLNLIIVDDVALIMPLTERLGFSVVADLACLGAGYTDDALPRMLRETRANPELVDDLLYYLVANTDVIEAARGIGGYPYLPVAFKEAKLPIKLDTEFDRIMLATGYERWVVKERLSHFEGWHKHHNESRRVPLPEGGYIKVNDEDPNLDSHFRLPRSKSTMNDEYSLTSYVPNPNQLRWNLLLIDDVARLDEYAQRLKITNFKSFLDVLNEGVKYSEAALSASLVRKENVMKIQSSLTENTTFYIIVPEEMLKAALISCEYRDAVFRQANLPEITMFIPHNSAFITKDYFLSVRGDDWSIHNKSVAPEANAVIIEAAYRFAINTRVAAKLPQTYTEAMAPRVRRLVPGLATTVDDSWLMQALEQVHKDSNRDFLNHWTVEDNSFLGAETIKKLRENPSLSSKGSYSRDLFTEQQLKQMQDLIPDVFLPDGTIEISVLTKYWATKRVMAPTRLPNPTMPAPVNLLPSVMPSVILDTIKLYLEEVKDKEILPFDDIKIEGGEDGLAFTVTFTSRDPVIKELLLKGGAVVVPEPSLTFVADIQNNDVAETYPLGRGLTQKATQELMKEQNPHMYAEVAAPRTPQDHFNMWEALDNSPGGAALYKKLGEE